MADQDTPPPSRKRPLLQIAWSTLVHARFVFKCLRVGFGLKVTVTDGCAANGGPRTATPMFEVQVVSCK